MPEFNLLNSGIFCFVEVFVLVYKKLINKVYFYE